jgi:hypothetical protein
MRALAQELVGLQSDVIFTDSTATTVAVQRETRTIPIVFVGVRDPVASGIVPRLDRPSGNITGFATSEASLGVNPDTAVPVSVYMPSLETAARSLKVAPKRVSREALCR